MFDRITSTKKSYLFRTAEAYICALLADKYREFTKLFMYKVVWFEPQASCRTAMSWLWDWHLYGEVFVLHLNKQWRFYPNGIRLFCV